METTNNLTLSNGCTIQEMIDNLHATREFLRYEEWGRPEIQIRKNGQG